MTLLLQAGAGAVIYVFSTTDRDSFEALPRWQRKVEEECGRISHVLVQNKMDLIDDAAMSRGEVEDMADAMHIRLYRACVQDNVNVREVFEYLCHQYLKAKRRRDDEGAVADIGQLSVEHASGRSRSSRSDRSSPRRARSSSEERESSERRRSSSNGRARKERHRSDRHRRVYDAEDNEEGDDRVNVTGEREERKPRGGETIERPQDSRSSMSRAEERESKEARRGRREDDEEPDRKSVV